MRLLQKSIRKFFNLARILKLNFLFHNKISDSKPYQSFDKEKQEAPKSDSLDPGDNIFFLLNRRHGF